MYIFGLICVMILIAVVFILSHKPRKTLLVDFNEVTMYMPTSGSIGSDSIVSGSIGSGSTQDVSTSQTSARMLDEMQNNWGVFKDWGDLEAKYIGVEYKPPTNWVSAQSRPFYTYSDHLNYEKDINPYADYYTYNPYDFAPTQGWNMQPMKRYWGNGRFTKYGYPLPKLIGY